MSRNRTSVASGTVTVIHGDAQEIPLADSSVDKVFSIHSLYFWNDLNTAMSEISRVLRPGGLVIFTVSDGTVSEDNVLVKDMLSTKVIPGLEQADFRIFRLREDQLPGTTGVWELSQLSQV